MADPWQGGHTYVQICTRRPFTMGTIARVTEISARSSESFEDAIRIGIERATATLRNVESAWVKEQSVTVTDGAVDRYQVNLLVTFELED
jgi:dodecin